MDIFGKFRKLDTSLQRGLDNGFARVFGGEVIPTEIDEVLKQQAENSVMVNSEGHRLAPSFFIVQIAQRDHDSLLEQHPNLNRELSNRLARYIRNEGWTTNSPVTVDIRPEEELHSGQLNTASRFNIPESYSPPAEVEESGADLQPSSEPGQAEWPESNVSHRSVAAKDYDADSDSFPSVSDANPSHSDSSPAAAAGAAAATGSATTGDADGAAAHRGGLGSVVQPGPGTQDQQDEQPAQPSDPQQSYPGTTVITHAANDETPIRGGTGEPHPEEHRQTVTLLLRDGSDRRYQLQEGSNLIGRGNTVDLRIPDTGVSRQHAEIVWDGYDAVLTDLQSTNGTAVNETPIENWLLADGDVIMMGHSEIEVQFIQ